MSATIEDNKALLSTRTPPHHIAPHPKEKEIISFEESWTSPFNLRPPHKDALKRYYSLKTGRDGTRALCFGCNIEFGIQQLQIHHIDHDRRNNQLSNIQLACEPCNNDERKQWLAERNRHPDAAHHIGTQAKERKLEQVEKLLQQELLKQAPTTFQKSVSYKQQVLLYLVQYVKETKSFDQAVFDIEAMTGCSHAKAIEYLNGFSMSSFAGWRQYFDAENGQWITPRQGSEAYERACKMVEEQINQQ